jgi:hypothetical protein
MKTPEFIAFLGLNVAQVSAAVNGQEFLLKTR